MNNVLFVPIYKEEIEFLKNFVKNNNINNLYCVTFDSSVQDEFYFKEVINYYDAINGNLFSYSENSVWDYSFNSLIPEYTEEILEMMNRNGNLHTDRRVAIYHANLVFWTNFLLNKKIDCVIFRFPHEVYDYLIYRLCEKLNIDTYISLPASCGPLQYAGMSDYIVLEKIEDINLENYFHIDKPKNEDCIKLKNINDYFEKVTYKYQNSLKIVNGNSRKQALKWRGGKGIHYIKSLIETTVLICSYRFLCDAYDADVKYIFFPLHFQPEGTTAPLAGLFANQLEAIRLLSVCIPKEYIIYVKEHPAQISFGRNLWFYSELKKISNVKLLDDRIPAELIVKNSVAVASLTGTILWDASYIGKPAIAFGITFAQHLSSVFRVNTIAECTEAINAIIKQKYKKTTAEEIRDLCLLIYSNSINEFDYNARFNKINELINYRKDCF